MASARDLQCCPRTAPYFVKRTTRLAVPASLVCRILLSAILFVNFASGRGSVDGRGAARRFISKAYGFSMAIPAGWGVSTELNTPVYFWGAPSAKFVQDAIPEGGAVIAAQAHDSVSGSAGSATTPWAWALAETRAKASAVPSIKPFEMEKLSESSSAVICSYDEAEFSGDQRVQHSVAIFWEFRQQLFAA